MKIINNNIDQSNGTQNQRNNEHKIEQNMNEQKNEWSFSTTIQPEDLVSQSNQNQNQNQKGKGPTLHNPMSGSKINDPTSSGHGVGTIPTKKTRIYHVSLSQSESESQNNTSNENSKNNNNKNTVQINRFKVEFGSRLSESGTVATQIDPSESNNEYIDGYDCNNTYNDDSDDENNQNDNQNENNHEIENNSLDSNGNQQQTIKIKRFHITPAKPDMDQSADEDEPHESHEPQSQPKQVVKKVVAIEQKKKTKPIINKKEDEYILPNKCKNEWSKSELSEWVGSFGNAFKH